MNKISKRISGTQPEDYTGLKFNKLIALTYLGNAKWLCKCDCGRDAVVTSTSIRNNTRTSCRSCTASLSSYKRNKPVAHYGFKNRLFREYRKGAIKRNLEFSLPQLDFFKLLETNCNYCGHPPILMGGHCYMDKSIPPLKRNGVDRKDTTLGYTLENCVACCSKCNYAKHIMLEEEFYNWIKRVYKFQNERSTTISKESTPK